MLVLQEKNSNGVQVFVWPGLLRELSASRGSQVRTAAEASGACQGCRCESREDLVVQGIHQSVHELGHRPPTDVVTLNHQGRRHSADVVEFNF